MNYPAWKAALWLLGYVVLVVLPLVVAYAGMVPASRGFWIEFGVGLGFVGLSMMALQFVLTGRFRHVAESLGLDTMLHFHRQIGMAGAALVLAHPVILIAANPEYILFLDPRPNLPRAVALVSVIVALALLLATTLWRQRLRIVYEWWRVGHGVLAFSIVFIGLVHILQVGYYVSPAWKQAVWAGLTGGALLLLVNARVVKPLRLKKQPYRVVDIRQERGSSHTLVLTPDGHTGMRFKPGQFAWLTLGDSPFSLQQHPFSFSSSSENREELWFTIKELGDFTATVADIEPGTMAFLEGPYGAFTLDAEHPDRETVFIAGGVGITPIMSILRTLRDRGDRRRLWLVFCAASEDRAIFWDEIRQMPDHLSLTVTTVLESPADPSLSESGVLTPRILDTSLPPPDDKRQYMICGPDPFMDMAEKHLLDSGVPMRSILSERFKIV